jgi:predicted MPP superfamily phosphohydrolase
MQGNRQTTVLRWLHLTDIHMGRNNESQRTALDSLITAITQHAENKPFDMVIITGDVAYSGIQQEYNEVESRLITPLRQIVLFRNATFFATPGNHDLDCEIELPPAWKELGRPRQEKYFHLGEDGKRIRGSRVKAFEQYSQFVRRAGIKSVDPLEQPAAAFSISVGDKQTKIISVNSAFFSDKEVSDYHKAPAPVHAIRTLIQQNAANDQVIIIAHHPPDWFIPETEQHLYSLLVESNALYLHGHEHRVRSKFSSRGLTYMGFGAAYQAPGDSAPNPYYRNSFAICELADTLHLCLVSWDAEHGQWRPEQNLSGDFVDRSPRLPLGYQLDLPRTRLVERGRAYSSVAGAIRRELHIEKCVWLVKNESKRWAELLSTIGSLRKAGDTYNLPTRSLPPGHVQFRVRDEYAICLVYAVSGYGDILNYEQLQSINTELDRQEYDSCIVATLGELSSDAKTLASQLASRKGIVVLERDEIVRRIVRNLSGGLEKTLLRAADANVYDGSLIVTESGFGLMLRDRRSAEASFQVIADTGEVAPESSSLVVDVRTEVPMLRQLRYDESMPAGASAVTTATLSPEFNRADYLEKSYAYFDNVKYAPLAALGFRFKNASLSEIYVDASADVGSSRSSSQLTRALAEFVESLNLPKAQQDQLESQLKTQYGVNRTAEVGAARKLYQRYNNVVVLGDPGSGKTCFVQHEILAYADPESESSGWYARHLPVYVSLSEAARLLDERTTIIKICEIVSSRRGIDLPMYAIEQAMADGRAAFFFDGLDEVGFLDKRIALVAQIRDLVDSHAHRGNRFVLASRPAAVQPVELPHSLTSLQLKGLTEDEIRTLAGRVLTQRLGDASLTSLSLEEQELIDRLLEDVKNVPGIARIARNPLLLTLLVLTYANTGALSTRRHLIYTQAVKTLVSVRGKYTREQQISESDLRTRLGAVALAIFKREIAEIPRRAEVVAVLSPLTGRAGAARSATAAAEAFMQEVAEATGLLVIHAKDAVSPDDLITFMHYSFLEYYAAAGLLARSYLDIVPPLSPNPRWREVITLMVGMLSEQSDVTPLLRNILDDPSPSDVISQCRTLLALDCATECDVPPETTQEILAVAIYNALSVGAGRYSADLRVELARRLDDLLLGPNSILEAAICQGLRAQDAITAAAFADMLARMNEVAPLSPSVVLAFEDCLDQENAVARAAALFAMERRKELRTPKALEIVDRSLRASVIEKHAALKAIASNPEIAVSLLSRVRELLDDSNPIVSAAAAQCLLAEVLNRRERDPEPALLEKVVLKLNQGSNEDTGLVLRGVTLDGDIVRTLVFSTDANESELAIRYVWLVKGDNHFAYDVLMQRLRTSTSARHQAACMESLRDSPSGIDLVTIADTDLICSLTEAENRNVRMAAARLLGEMPDDEQVVRALQRYLEACASSASREFELSVAARALAKHVTHNPRMRIDALTFIMERIPKNAEAGFGSDVEQQHTNALLSVCESLGSTESAFAWRLKNLAEDYRTPLAIRRQSLRVFGSMVEPDGRSIQAFIDLLSRDDTRVNDAIYSSVAAFVGQCRKKVEYVRLVYSKLEELRSVLCNAWNREGSRVTDSISPFTLRNIRYAVLETSNLSMAYEEFSIPPTSLS